HVAPQQVTPVAEPHRTLAPACAGPQPLDAGERQPVLVEFLVERAHRRVGVAQARAPLVGGHPSLPQVFPSSACAMTLRITFGSASSPARARPTQRMPFGAGAPRGTVAANTVSCNGKCVNMWLTAPGSLRHFGLPRSAGADRSAQATSKSCDQSLPGTSVIFASRPLSGRVRRRIAPSARSATKAAPRRNLPSRFGALRG